MIAGRFLCCKEVVFPILSLLSLLSFCTNVCHACQVHTNGVNLCARSCNLSDGGCGFERLLSSNIIFYYSYRSFIFSLNLPHNKSLLTYSTFLLCERKSSHPLVARLFPASTLTTILNVDISFARSRSFDLRSCCSIDVVAFHQLQ